MLLKCRYYVGQLFVIKHYQRITGLHATINHQQESADIFSGNTEAQVKEISEGYLSHKELSDV